MRKRWWAIARVLISLGLLAFVLVTIGVERIWNSLSQADPGPLLLAFALFLIGIGVRAVRWYTLLAALGLEVRLRRVVYLYFVGNFFNAFLPTGFGGDVVRVLELSQEAKSTAVLGTVIVDRLTGLLVLFAMALVALPFTIELLPPETWLTIGLISSAGLAAGLLILQGHWVRRWGGWLPGPLSLSGEGPLARAYDAVTACGWQAVGQALAISLLFNILLVLEHFLTAKAVGISISLSYFMIFVPVLSLALTLPLSIGGLGLREVIAVPLFAQIGIDEAMTVAYSLAIYAIARITGLLGGLLYLLQGINTLRQRSEPSAQREQLSQDETL
jgi:uncharacterized membrane protein YbhN (UPF0104 family)